MNFPTRFPVVRDHHASAPSSAHLVFGPSGTPEPNVGRLEAAPFVCFADANDSNVRAFLDEHRASYDFNLTNDGSKLTIATRPGKPTNPTVERAIAERYDAIVGFLGRHHDYRTIDGQPAITSTSQKPELATKSTEEMILAADKLRASKGPQTGKASPAPAAADGTPKAAGETAETPATERVFTEAEASAMLRKAAAEAEAKIAGELRAREAEQRAQLATLKRRIEDGVSADVSNRIDLEQAVAKSEKVLGDKLAEVAKLEAQMRLTEFDHTLTRSLLDQQLAPEAMRGAMAVFRADAKVEYGADGKVAYVDVEGVGTYLAIDAAVDAWLKSPGASVFARARVSGARTSAGGVAGFDESGRPIGLAPDGRTLLSLSTEELVALADRSRATQSRTPAARPAATERATEHAAWPPQHGGRPLTKLSTEDLIRLGDKARASGGR